MTSSRKETRFSAEGISPHVYIIPYQVDSTGEPLGNVALMGQRHKDNGCLEWRTYGGAIDECDDFDGNDWPHITENVVRNALYREGIGEAGRELAQQVDKQDLIVLPLNFHLTHTSVRRKERESTQHIWLGFAPMQDLYALKPAHAYEAVRKGEHGNRAPPVNGAFNINDITTIFPKRNGHKAAFIQEGYKQFVERAYHHVRRVA